MFTIQYYPIIKWEENLLQNKFGEEYHEYKKKVPAFIPNFKKGLFQGEHDFKKAFKSERSTLSTIFILYLIIVLKFTLFPDFFNNLLNQG